MSEELEEIRKELRSLLDGDRLYDKKSLIWENGRINEVQDDRDLKDIPEGRFGEFKVERVNTEMGVKLLLPLTEENKKFKNPNETINTGSHFKIHTENRILELETLTESEYKMMVQACESSKFLYKSSNEENNGLQKYEGMIGEETDGDTHNDKWMLGNVVFFEGQNNEIYAFTYAGIGNYTDIKMESSFILNKIIWRIRR
ncbi:MAG: hypothetical protein E7256_11150 [Lachnospiraceae bacterium]|nr:hypothetical protein [Lachnospiraceae bacterium]